MRVSREQAMEVQSAWNNQRNEELYNNKDKERCSDCGYIKDGTACRKKCKGETSGRYSWLFILIAFAVAYYYFKL